MSFGLGGSQTSQYPESGAGGFLQSLLGSLHAVNANRNEMDMEKLQVGAAQRAAATQQLQQLIPILKANQRMLSDPKMIAKVKQLSQLSGMPNPIETTPGTPATAASGQVGASDTTDTSQASKPATMPTESINMGIVAPPVGWNDLDLASKDRVMAAIPGDQRNALIGNMSGVPDYVRSAPAMMTGGEKVQVLKNFRSAMSEFNKGISSSQGLSTELKASIDDMHAVGYSTDQIINDITQNAVMGPETSAQIAKFDSTIDVNLSKADHEKALTAYENLITKEQPEKLAAMIRDNDIKAQADATNAQSGQIRAETGVQKLSIDEQNAQTNRMNANTRLDSVLETSKYHQQMADAATSRAQNAKNTLDFNMGRAALVQINTTAANLGKDYTAAQKNYMAAAAAGVNVEAPDTAHPNPDGSPGPSLGDQVRALGVKRDQLLQQQMDATQFLQSQGTNAFRGASGNPSAQITDPNIATPRSSSSLQPLMVDGAITGYMNMLTSPPTYVPIGGATQPQGGVPGGQPRQDKVNTGPKPNQPDPKTNKAGIPPKDMRPGTVDFFKTLTPDKQVLYLQSPKISTDVKQYLRTLAPKTNEQHVEQAHKANPAATPPATSSRTPVTQQPTDAMGVPMQTPAPAQAQPTPAQTPPQASAPQAPPAAQKPADPWSAVDSVKQQIEGGGTWLDRLGGALSRQFGPSGGVNPTKEPTAEENLKNPANQQKLAQAAIPVAIRELHSGVSADKVLHEMTSHGMTRENALSLLKQIHEEATKSLQPIQSPWGGSEGTNPKGSLPANLLMSIEKAESSGGRPQYEHSLAGAEGPFQFMPQTAAEYGVKNPYDLVDSARGAARYLTDLGTEFHHDWAKAIAAYNWGEGNVERVVKQRGDDWYKYLPTETSNYVAEVMGGLQ